MREEHIIKLVEEFEKASSSADGLLTSMDNFKEVLGKFYKTYQEIIYLKEEIEVNKVFDKIIVSTKELEEINKQVTDNIDNLNVSVEQMNQRSVQGSEKIKLINQDLEKSLDILNKINLVLDNFESVSIKLEQGFNIGIFDSKIGSIEKNISSIEKLLNNYDIKFIEKFNSIDDNIKSNSKFIKGQMDKSVALLDSTYNSIIESSEMFKTTNVELGEDIKRLVETNLLLNSTIKGLVSQNENAFEVFSKLADEWADKNIHGIAIKKKGKK